MKTADLHFHSTFSDGKHSLEELSDWLDGAYRDANLGLAVLTDHDGVAAFESWKTLAKPWWPKVCATELSCEFYDPEEGRIRGLHLLAYGIDPQHLELQAYFKKFKESRAQRALQIVDKLKDAGIDIDVALLRQTSSGVLGRPHIADALIQQGIVATRHEAFERYLHDDSPYHVKKYRLDLGQACELARRLGWRTSVAHPGQHSFRERQLKAFKDLGVDALEIFHPRHCRDDLIFYRNQAQKLDFFVTGGSDFHDERSDRRGEVPSVGRTEYLLDDAKKFLRHLI